MPDCFCWDRYSRQPPHNLRAVHAEQTPGVGSESPGEPIDGTPTESVSHVPRDPAADAGFTSETIDLSATTHLPIQIQAYEGLTLVRKIDFSNVKAER